MALDALSFRSEPIRLLAFGSIGPTYTNIGTPFEHAGRQILIVNATNELLMFSDDPTATQPDKFVVPGATSIIFDITANKTSNSGFFSAERTQIAVKHLGVAPDEGTVYLSVFYGKGQ